MSKKKATAISLPISRTAKIMTSAVGVESVNQDIVATATKATEIFLTDFARRAYDLCDSNILDYDDITRLVHSDPRYDFLIDTTPKRIKFSEALNLIEENKRLESSGWQGQNETPIPDETSTNLETKDPELQNGEHGTPDSSSHHQNSDDSQDES